jgi:aromatic ring-cleaving dioxygenase
MRFEVKTPGNSLRTPIGGHGTFRDEAAFRAGQHRRLVPWLIVDCMLADEPAVHPWR